MQHIVKILLIPSLLSLSFVANAQTQEATHSPTERAVPSASAPQALQIPEKTQQTPDKFTEPTTVEQCKAQTKHSKSQTTPLPRKPLRPRHQQIRLRPSLSGTMFQA
jgi:hypothetical protein